MSTYVIAVRREHQRDVPPNWADPLFRIEGLEIEGDPKHLRLLASGPDDALKVMASQFSSFCHVEPTMEHLPLNSF